MPDRPPSPTAPEPVLRGEVAPHGPDRDEERLRQTARLIGIAIVALVVVGFIAQNTRRVTISFVFFDAQASLIWLIVVTLVAGLVGGYLLAGLVRRRMRRRHRG